jgi:uncharacterized protein YjdB
MWKHQNGDWLNSNQTTNNQSIGISAKPTSGHGLSSAWVNASGNAIMPEDFEFYQVIDKDSLTAGTYKVQCQLGHEAGNQFTTQRLFANQNVQFLRAEGDYSDANKTPGEIYTYAGHTPEGLDALKEMTVYVTIGEEDSLKIGIRSGNLQKSGTGGTTGGNTRGAFKIDYFRLTKIDDTPRLTALSVPVGTLSPEFDPGITEYTATLPAGLQSVTPYATVGEYVEIQSGTEAVDVSSGTGVSTIIVKSRFDDANTQTYTINYTTGSDIDYTGLIVNNSFEYAGDGTLLDADGDGVIDDSHADKGKTDATTYRVKNSTEKEFYGWRVSNWDFASASNNSQGMNRDMSPVDKIHGTFATWLGGDLQFKVNGEDTNAFEFYQIIDKDSLPAGTYKIQCRLAVANNKRTSQRLFANNSVQYHGTELQYASNQTDSEQATFAGWPDGEKNLQEMVVYATIGEDDSLKIGIRTGNIKGDGTVAANANPLWGWFKADYFRLTKLDAEAKLTALSLPVGTLSPAFDSGITEYTATLPDGVQSITPDVAAGEHSVIQSGTEAVDVSSGTGVSTIVVISKFDEADVKTYTVNYTVIVPVSGVSLDTASVELEIDETLQLNATVSPENATNKEVIWRSDAEQVAEVSETGLITAIAKGTANIIVETKDGALKDTCRVTVKVIGTGIGTTGSNQPSQVWYADDALRLVNLEGYTAALISIDGQTVAGFRINTPDDTYSQALPAGVYFLVAKKSDDRKVFKVINK